MLFNQMIPQFFRTLEKLTESNNQLTEPAAAKSLINGSSENDNAPKDHLRVKVQ